jgi:hypothetical protein
MGRMFFSRRSFSKMGFQECGFQDYCFKIAFKEFFKEASFMNAFYQECLFSRLLSYKKGESGQIISSLFKEISICFVWFVWSRTTTK